MGGGELAFLLLSGGGLVDWISERGGGLKGKGGKDALLLVFLSSRCACSCSALLLELGEARFADLEGRLEFEGVADWERAERERERESSGLEGHTSSRSASDIW